MAITTVRWSSIGSQEKFRSLAQATYVAPTPSTMGMVLLTPTSIAHSGTSASIGANGQVTFTAVTSLSLNGVFSATYDNYMVSLKCSASSATNVSFRLRVAGTDNSTASSYVGQNLLADSTTVAGARNTDNQAYPFASYPTQRDGGSFFLYGPFLAQPTAGRSVTVLGYLSAYLYDTAFTHNQSTSYDGFTIFPSSAGSPNITGALQVYGVKS